LKDLNKIKVIISGGGTGGHIYPAVAIANEIKMRYPSASILFVGAEGRMEMEKVPKAGYEIIGLPIAGIQRKLTLKNLSVPIKLIKSLLKARTVVRSFNPDIAVGVGGYASGPMLWMSTRKKVPSLIQEQNSFAGLTNKLLGKRVQKICVAYSGMEKYFPEEKIVFTGNPVRQDLLELSGKREEAIKHFNLSKEKKTLLVIGGSLGARTINEAIEKGVLEKEFKEFQVIWQTGKWFVERAKKSIENNSHKNIWVSDFIYDMDKAYSAADIIVSRAGALSVSEICLAGKPAILIPSPNVSEDHQTKNAMSLVNENAAIFVKDVDAKKTLIPEILDLMKNEKKQSELAENVLDLARPNATKEIVNQIETIV